MSNNFDPTNPIFNNYNGEKYLDTQIVQRHLEYVELAILCKNINLIKKIINHYNLIDVNYQNRQILDNSPKYIYNYLIDKTKFYKKSGGGGLMSLIAWGETFSY